ncbi:MAG: isochorismatase family protein [Dehalococcoidia bacterium]|nr:isochorismatase family protein [Dehalococcoidia bacterium]
MSTARTVQIEDQSEALNALNGWLQIDPQKTAIVTIDMHRGHLDPQEATLPVAPELSERVRGASKDLLTFARSKGIPVIHVILTWRPLEAYKFNPRIDAARITMSRQKPTTDAQRRGVAHNIVGSVQTELMPEIGPEEGDHVIDNKKTLSSFYGTDLQLLLSSFLKVDTVVLMGINTNTCVLNAAFEGMNQGYKMVVARECVGSMYGEDLHEFGLQNVARCLGWVLGIDEIKQKVNEFATSEPQRELAGVS